MERDADAEDEAYCVDDRDMEMTDTDEAWLARRN
jgi:hypothetical protein